MPATFRTSIWPLVSHTCFAMVLVSGCGTQEPSSVNPTPSAPPANPGTTARPAPSPAQDIKDIKQELQDVKKAVTPAPVIKPDAPTTPAPAKKG
jgi:hypothetical protein